jgi:hypothetical protein
MSTKIHAVARVQITVEFAVGGHWAADAPIEQVRRQAREAAVDSLRRGLSIDGLVNTSQSKTVAEIVGEPKITAILVVNRSLLRRAEKEPS